LERPISFALPTLSQEELQTIFDALKDEQFPDSTAFEKHNKNCFEDFLRFTKKYIDNDQERTYISYQQDDGLSAGVKAEMLVLYEGENPKAHFEALILHYFQQECSSKEEAALQWKQAIQKQAEVLSIFDQEEQELAYRASISAPTASVCQSLLQQNVEKLRALLREHVLKPMQEQKTQA
jgi:hypothetical protein